jgi:hypothetical protein
MPAAFSTSAGKMWLVEASVAPTVIWPPLRVLRELGPALPRRLGARGEHRGGRRDHADRLEVRVSDVAEAGIEGQVDVVVHGVERVAVRRRVLRLARADGPRCAGDIGDDDRLAEMLLQLGGERAKDVVGVAARRPRHDHLDRPLGELGRGGAGEGRGGEAEDGGCKERLSHVFPPGFVLAACISACFRPA